MQIQYIKHMQNNVNVIKNTVCRDLYHVFYLLHVSDQCILYNTS
jgi:hypothetical protein